MSFGVSILHKIFRHKVILKKITETIVDPVWGTSTFTEKEYTIKALIIPLTLEDLRWMPTGKWTTGDARGYFHPKYQIGTETVEVRPGDKIVYAETEYSVDYVSDYEWNIKLREAYLKRKS